MNFTKIFLLTAGMLLGASVFAQNNIKGVLIDESTGEPVGFATVSLTRDGQTRPTKYSLTDDKGAFTLESVRNGSYAIVAELLGYEPYSSQIKMESKTIDLGEIKMKVDREQLEAAEVNAVGNPVIVKKDTIEYNAGSFLSTDNDNLVDLLKKMPGIEVADNGTITVNGQSVSKITVQGKTFFLDDPTVASQNIPAKLVKKLKVIRKKSEQAEFTGIDDGNEETVIDLSLTEGSNLNGLVGRVTAGVGHDIPSEQNPLNEYRFSGNAFLGNFSGNTQISLILNANNANVQGSTNFSGNMMAGMMGGGGGGGMGGGMGMGGGGGLTTSYMAGLNAAADAFDGRMEVGGNYNYNNNNSISGSESSTTSYLSGMNQLQNSESNSTTGSYGHNFGLRLEHKFSDNTSIVFEPRVRFGGNTNVSSSKSETFQDVGVTGNYNKVNDAVTDNTNDNKNISTSGFLLFRQRLGLPGRTLTVNTNFNLSDNKMNSLNNSTTNSYVGGNVSQRLVSQNSDQDQQSYSVSTRATYTEPLGNYFYLEANYSFNWSKSLSEKNTYDLLNGGILDPQYSNAIENLNRRHEFGGNVLYQDDRMHLQAGFTAIPQYTYNSTTVYDAVTNSNKPQEYEDNRWNFSPTVMMMFDLNDNDNLRFFYRGNSSQPSTQQLMPVPDNTNPLRVTFGNPTLTPYFTHNINGEFRHSNRANFSSFNIRANGGFTQNQISNVVITGSNGGQYTIPFNAPVTGNAGMNFFNNFPLDKNGIFSVNNNTGVNWRQSFAYEGVNVDMTKYTDGGFYEFMNWFIDQFNDPAYYKAHIVENFTDNLSVNERLRVTYRGIQFQATLGASTNMNQTWYTQKGDAVAQSTKAARNTQTWSNAVTGELTWNWLLTGMSLTANANYRWYNGYTTPVDPQCIINFTVAKSLGPVNLSLYVADLLGQSRALSVTDQSSRHAETLSTTQLGRYFIVSLSYNFGTLGGRRGGMRGGMGGGRRGGGGGMPPMGGGMPPMGGGGRPPMM
ncbi:MAG: outer membrane beta-barrel protein [Bacteroidales bacterium]|nr:outer membrane beta-barrel protein [Bacteroidales bacterium]